MKRIQKTRERCDALFDVIKGIVPAYNKGRITENQRQFIETIIGAAIWYLPHGKEYWTKRISIAAIKEHHPHEGIENPKLTKDHQYPRKIAAKELLEMKLNKLSGERILDLYKKKYSKFNYITPRENRMLLRFQRKGKFTEPLRAYKQAGVKLVEISEDDLRRVVRREKSLIEKLLKKKK